MLAQGKSGTMLMNEINTRRMKLSQLHALVAVADCGNFSDAGLQLELSQSAVSHAIATLEEELGVSLFHRGRYGAHLTPVGERVTGHARQMLQLLEMMAKEALIERGLQRGQVRIASFRSVATHVLPGVIAKFRGCFPDIAVSITEHFDYLGVEQALRVGKADIGFTYLPTSEDFEGSEILRDEYVVMLPPVPHRRPLKLSWEQLATYPLILPPSNSACCARVRHLLANSPVPMQIAYEVNEDSTIVSMAVQGLGAAILPRLAAEPIPPALQVCSLPIPLERVIGVIVVKDALLTPAVFAFLETLKAGRQPPDCILVRNGAVGEDKFCDR